MEVGSIIKRYRQKQGLTLAELAARTELTKGYLSQLENDLTSPSIATLSDIVEALGVSMSEFFSQDKHVQYVFSQNDYFIDQHDDYSIAWVVPNAQKNEMEPILLTLEKQGQSRRFYVHDGQEFGYVLTGKIALVFDDTVLKVKKGETFYLFGDKEYVIKNLAQSKSKVLWVCTPPIL